MVTTMILIKKKWNDKKSPPGFNLQVFLEMNKPISFKKIRKEKLTWEIMVRWRELDPKVMTLLFITVSLSFSISAIVISTTPFLLSQWTLIRTFTPDDLASISGNAIHSSSVSATESLDLFKYTTDSMVLWLACSSRNLTLSCKCFRYFIVPPSTDALSVFKPN